MPSLRQIINATLNFMNIDTHICRASEYNRLREKLKKSAEDAEALRQELRNSVGTQYRLRQSLSRIIIDIRQSMADNGLKILPEWSELEADIFQFESTSPSHDEDFYDGRPRKIVLIASAPRVGSTLLLEGLVAAGALPYSAEMFNPAHIQDFYLRWGRLSDAEYLERLFQYRTNKQGLFGVKAHYDHYERFMGLAPPESCDIILIERRDKIAQAVSYYFGIQTQQWASFQWPARKKEEVPYDYEALFSGLQQISGFALDWRELLTGRGLEPKYVIYEDFSRDYQATVADLSSWITGREVKAEDIVPPRMRILRDEVSLRFKEKFIQDMRDRGIDETRYQALYWPDRADGQVRTVVPAQSRPL
jgi:LPS sulfotransferase NodH